MRVGDVMSGNIHLGDIVDLDYRQWAPGHFDYIHASPPCTEYSVALMRRLCRLEEADVLAQRALEVIRYVAEATLDTKH